MQRRILPLLLMALVTSVTFAQTIVSTTPENKKVILEEFTGIKCVYCPEGHAIAQAIQNNNPGDVFLINIHVGSFAVPGAGEPDFRTPFGTAIANQSNLIGYPAGTVNRHYFPGQAQNGGTGTAMSRGAWTSTSNETLGLDSYLNMAAEATIDVATRELSVHVESFYTGDSPESTNQLNVALLQNNTLGPQTGGGAGDEYVHQHRLVYLVTGQWGEVINTTTTGSFVDSNFTYTIPEMYNNVPAELADMEVVVFMTETNQEVISGNGTFPTFTNFEYQNDILVKKIHEISEKCVNELAPVVEIQNVGENTATAIEIEYDINGESHTYSWTGTLTPLATEVVELPTVNFEFAGTNTVTVSIQDDENNSNNQMVTNFDDAQEYSGDLTLVINTDNWGEECTWNIKDYLGNTVANGGPYADNTTITEVISLTEENCYTFNLIDSYGDGGGPVSLTDDQGTVLYQTNGSYGSGESKNFGFQQFILGNDASVLNNVVLFPNPAQSTVTLINAENAVVTVYNLLGQKLMEQKQISNQEVFEISNFQAGTYLVKIEKDGQTAVEKLVIIK